MGKHDELMILLLFEKTVYLVIQKNQGTKRWEGWSDEITTDDKTVSSWKNLDERISVFFKSGQTRCSSLAHTISQE